MSKKFLNASGAFLRHSIGDGRQFTGVMPVEDTVGDTATSTASRLSWSKTNANGLGLFYNVHELFALGASSTSKRPYVISQIHVVVSAGVDWTLALTSGFADGTATTDVDDPANDVELLTGSGPGFEMLSLVISSGKSLRFTTASACAGASPWFVEIYVHANTDRRGTYNM